MASSVYLIHPGAAGLSPMPREVKQKSKPAHQAGRLTVVFEEDDLVGLLRDAVEREGGQTAFAKRYKVDRSRKQDLEPTAALQRGHCKSAGASTSLHCRLI